MHKDQRRRTKWLKNNLLSKEIVRIVKGNTVLIETLSVAFAYPNIRDSTCISFALNVQFGFASF